jgi:hypothetical protein
MHMELTGDDVRIELEALERTGWDSLCNGTGSDYYGALMSEDGVMVLADGQAMSRAQVVDSLAGSSPWEDYSLDDLQLVSTGEGSAALVYRGTGRRASGPDVVAIMTSVYVCDDAGWQLALYTQTPVPA